MNKIFFNLCNFLTSILRLHFLLLKTEPGPWSPLLTLQFITPTAVWNPTFTWPTTEVFVFICVCTMCCECVEVALTMVRLGSLRTVYAGFVPAYGRFPWDIGNVHDYKMTAMWCSHPPRVCMGSKLLFVLRLCCCLLLRALRGSSWLSCPPSWYGFTVML